MKLKAAITRGALPAIVEAFGSDEFADAFLDVVVGKAFGVPNPISRPAEYYVQRPDITNRAGGFIGVEVRLTGVSRDGRTPKVFHDALVALDKLVGVTAAGALKGTDSDVQIFVVMMLDKEIEVSPGSGIYSNVLEAPARWVIGFPSESTP